jgi:hypothetical protein
MFDKETLDKIWKQVKENSKKLDSCDLHEFERLEPKKFGSKYKCKKCEGECSGTDYLWYLKGLEHGKNKIGGVIGSPSGGH